MNIPQTIPTPAPVPVPVPAPAPAAAQSAIICGETCESIKGYISNFFTGIADGAIGIKDWTVATATSYTQEGTFLNNSAQAVKFGVVSGLKYVAAPAGAAVATHSTIKLLQGKENTKDEQVKIAAGVTAVAVGVLCGSSYEDRLLVFALSLGGSVATAGYQAITARANTYQISADDLIKEKEALDALREAEELNAESDAEEITEPTAEAAAEVVASNAENVEPAIA